MFIAQEDRNRHIPVHEQIHMWCRPVQRLPGDNCNACCPPACPGLALFTCQWLGNRLWCHQQLSWPG